MNGKQRKPNGYVEEVHSFVRQVPFGKVCTYGIIADCLALGSARMVGWALNKSFGYEPPVPAHRIVNRKGELSGRNHFAAPTMMQELLEAEGIEIEDNKVKNLDRVLFNPLEEM
jgi:methylated-DNA-protein-cysteine methyltransferase-like protein